MKIIGCYDSISGAKHFKLLHCPIGTRYEATLSPSAWRVIDDDYSLLQLLTRNKMLAFENDEARWAKHKLKSLRKLKALAESDTTLDYCLSQAKSVPIYGDDPMYRIATKLVDEQKFAYYDKYGLSTDVRKLILAFVMECGVVIG